jgi:hypothetical protein
VITVLADLAEAWTAWTTGALAVATFVLVVVTVCMARGASRDSHRDRLASRRPVVAPRPNPDGKSFMVKNIGEGPAFDVEVWAYPKESHTASSNLSIGVVGVGETPLAHLTPDTGFIVIAYSDIGGETYYTHSAGDKPAHAYTGPGDPPWINGTLAVVPTKKYPNAK